jgi:archaemetzincin
MLRFLFSSFVILVSLSCFHSEINIGIQPYKGFDYQFLDSVALALQKTYSASIIILPERSLPKNAFVTIKTPRYRADSILIDLKNNMPKGIDYILGLTNSDISTTKYDKDRNILAPESKYRDWGVFGLGYQPGPSCVVSTYRLKNPDRNIFISRLEKVCIHEIGHNLGLKHCKSSYCVMRDAVEKIQTVDSVGFDLCDNCKRKI